jgi:5-methylcytosine-specific restriction endonuclease McrA
MSGVLVLDRAYQPIGHSSLEDAVLKLIQKKAFPVPGTSIIAVYRSQKLVIEVPSILMLTVVVPIHKKMNKYGSKKLVFARDNYTCQYCGRTQKELKSDEFLTIDHIIPKFHFKNPRDVSKWTNVTTACNSCNNKKDNKLPHECNMYPATKPYKPESVMVVIYTRLTDEQKTFLKENGLIQ